MIDWSALWQEYQQEWKRLLIVISSALVISIGALYGATQWLTQQQQQLQAQRSALRQAQQELSTAQQLLAEAQQHLDTHRQLEARGFVGVPKPLEWTEVLLTIVRASGLPTLRFELEPAQTIQLPESARQRRIGDTANEPISLGLQEMHFELIELHEEEWAQIITALEHNQEGLFRLESCNARRSAAIGLDLTCTGQWWFFQPHTHREE